MGLQLHRQNPTYTLSYTRKYNVIETVTVVGIFADLNSIMFRKKYVQYYLIEKHMVNVYQ